MSAPSADGGAERRFEALYRAYERAVLAFLVRRHNHVQDAEDLLIETFAEAWRKFRDIPAGFELPWLYVVAWKKLANKLRGERRRGALESKLIDHEKTARQGGEPAANERLEAAMALLKESDRELLRLVAWEGLTTAQIAAAYGITIGAATGRLHRARAALRKAYEALGGGDDE